MIQNEAELSLLAAAVRAAAARLADEAGCWLAAEAADDPAETGELVDVLDLVDLP